MKKKVKVKVSIIKEEASIKAINDLENKPPENKEVNIIFNKKNENNILLNKKNNNILNEKKNIIRLIDDRGIPITNDQNNNNDNNNHNSVGNIKIIWSIVSKKKIKKKLI